MRQHASAALRRGAGCARSALPARHRMPAPAVRRPCSVPAMPLFCSCFAEKLFLFGIVWQGQHDITQKHVFFNRIIQYLFLLVNTYHENFFKNL